MSLLTSLQQKCQQLIKIDDSFLQSTYTAFKPRGTRISIVKTSHYNICRHIYIQLFEIDECNIVFHLLFNRVITWIEQFNFNFRTITEPCREVFINCVLFIRNVKRALPTPSRHQLFCFCFFSLVFGVSCCDTGAAGSSWSDQKEDIARTNR